MSWALGHAGVIGWRPLGVAWAAPFEWTVWKGVTMWSSSADVDLYRLVGQRGLKRRTVGLEDAGGSARRGRGLRVHRRGAGRTGSGEQPAH